MKSRLVLGILIVLTFCVAGWAQTGSITGTVKDPSGAAVQGATVVVTSPDRGINREMQTNSTWRLQPVGPDAGRLRHRCDRPRLQEVPGESRKAGRS